MFKPSIRTGKKCDLSDFEHGVVVGPSISVSADLLGFSLGFAENDLNTSVQQFSGWKRLVDARGQRRMARLVRADRKATGTQITTRYNRGVQKSISERTARWTLKQMDYSSKQETEATIYKCSSKLDNNIEDWKNVAWSVESGFLLWHSDGRVRIWSKRHENMDPSCLVSTVQDGGGGVMVWGVFSWHTLGPLVPTEHR